MALENSQVKPTPPPELGSEKGSPQVASREPCAIPLGHPEASEQLPAQVGHVPSHGQQPGHLQGGSRPHHQRARQTGSHLEEENRFQQEQKGTGAAPDIPIPTFLSFLGKL